MWFHNESQIVNHKLVLFIFSELCYSRTVSPFQQKFVTFYLSYIFRNSWNISFQSSSSNKTTFVVFIFSVILDEKSYFGRNSCFSWNNLSWRAYAENHAAHKQWPQIDFQYFSESLFPKKKERVQTFNRVHFSPFHMEPKI